MFRLIALLIVLALPARAQHTAVTLITMFWRCHGHPHGAQSKVIPEIHRNAKMIEILGGSCMDYGRNTKTVGPLIAAITSAIHRAATPKQWQISWEHQVWHGTNGTNMDHAVGCRRTIIIPSPARPMTT